MGQVNETGGIDGPETDVDETREGKVHRKMEPMAMRVTEMGASEGCPVIGQIDCDL
jgi:hypothetical protein